MLKQKSNDPGCLDGLFHICFKNFDQAIVYLKVL
jgi:hypothetical protein